MALVVRSVRGSFAWDCSGGDALVKQSWRENPIGTLFSMATMLNQRIPGFVDSKTKAFPRQASLPGFTARGARPLATCCGPGHAPLGHARVAWPAQLAAPAAHAPFPPFQTQLFALCLDGIAIIIGSLLGCAPLTVYIESADDAPLR